MPPHNPPWWRPDRFAARRPRLEARMAALEAIRRHFRAAGFLEVETPALQISPGLEPHLTPFATTLREPFREGPVATVYLHTSPEYAMKKLLVAGMPLLFQFARVFRNGERSATHHPEFTMLEWYRAGASWRDVAADCLAILRLAATDLCKRGETACDPRREAEYLSVAEAFRRHADVDLFASAPDPTSPDRERLAADAARIGVWTGPRDTWEDVFFRIFLARVEAKLGVGRPTFLHDYPASMAALARISRDDPRVCERFELFVCGLELANGFGELTDAVEQRRRFEADLEARRGLYGDSVPIDEDFLAALAHGMPESAGVALGFDRLVMLATGAATIEDVLWAPVAGPPGSLC